MTGTLYFVKSDGIYSRNLSNGRIERRVALPEGFNVDGLAVDGERLYWLGSGQNIENGSLISEALHGNDSPRTLVSGIHEAAGLTFAGDELYWLSREAIGAVRTDGAQPQPNYLVLPQGEGGGIGGDMTSDGHGNLYVSRCLYNKSISRIQLSTKTVTASLVSSDCPQALASDGHYLYWGQVSDDTNPGEIGRVDLATGEVEDSWTSTNSEPGPYDLAATAGAVFWTWGGVAEGPTYIELQTTDQHDDPRWLTGSGPLTVGP